MVAVANAVLAFSVYVQVIVDKAAVQGDVITAHLKGHDSAAEVIHQKEGCARHKPQETEADAEGETIIIGDALILKPSLADHGYGATLGVQDRKQNGYAKAERAAQLKQEKML